MTNLRTAISELRREPWSVNDAICNDGLPRAAGLYGWWVVPDSLPVPVSPHPSHPNWSLLYVGIAPARATSTQTVRTRVIGNHLSGNTGSSTFRLSLAALLLEELGLTPVRTSSKVVLPPAQNKTLSDWQRDNLGLTWTVHPEAWLIEPDVIAEMAPPMNLAANRSHPFATELTAARKRFRGVAR